MLHVTASAFNNITVFFAQWSFMPTFNMQSTRMIKSLVLNCSNQFFLNFGQYSLMLLTFNIVFN